eukprot:4168375-Pleurochrysis_carterae.AAC.1
MGGSLDRVSILPVGAGRGPRAGATRHVRRSGRVAVAKRRARTGVGAGGGGAGGGGAGVGAGAGAGADAGYSRDGGGAGGSGSGAMGCSDAEGTLVARSSADTDQALPYADGAGAVACDGAGVEADAHELGFGCDAKVEAIATSGAGPWDVEAGTSAGGARGECGGGNVGNGGSNGIGSGSSACGCSSGCGSSGSVGSGSTAVSLLELQHAQVEDSGQKPDQPTLRETLREQARAHEHARACPWTRTH